MKKKHTKVAIRGQNEIGSQFAKYYQELYDAAQNPINKYNLINFFPKREFTLSNQRTEYQTYKANNRGGVSI